MSLIPFQLILAYIIVDMNLIKAKIILFLPLISIILLVLKYHLDHRQISNIV